MTKPSATKKPASASMKVAANLSLVSKAPAVIEASAVPEVVAAPVAMIATQPEQPAPTDHNLHYDVLFHVPAGSKLKCDHGKPVQICVSIGRHSTLKISGDPDVLGAIDLIKGDYVRGTLTLLRTLKVPHKVLLASLEVRSSSGDAPTLAYHMLSNVKENFTFGKRGRGVMYQAGHCIHKIVMIEQVEQTAKLLAA